MKRDELIERVVDFIRNTIQENTEVDAGDLALDDFVDELLAEDESESEDDDEEQSA